MARSNLTAREAYFHPDDPAGWLKPGESFLVGGLDWSWAFVVYRETADFPGYCVGTNGLVWSRRSKSGRIRQEWRKRSPTVRKSGHLFVSLSDRDRVRVVGVHTLVMETFIGPRPAGFHCRHWDGVPANNRLSNLCWGTPQENSDDTIRHGTRIQGSRCDFAKLSEDQVAEILNRIRQGARKRHLAKEFGVTPGTIDFIVKGLTWKHVFAEVDGSSIEYKPSRFCRLSLADLKIARQLWAQGMLQREIAQRFGMSQPGISRALRERPFEE